MPQKQTLLTFDIQYLNAADVNHFYNIDESLYRKLQYRKMHVQIYSCFLDFFYMKTMGLIIASRDNRSIK